MGLRDTPVVDVLDKLAVLLGLAAVGFFLNQPSRPAPAPEVPAAGSTAGMDEIWRDAINEKGSSLKLLPALRVAPKPAAPAGPVSARAPEPQERYVPAPAPRPAPALRIAPKLKPVSFSFGQQGSRSASSSAFYSYPKAARPSASVSPPASRSQSSAAAPPDPSNGRPWRKMGAR